MKKQVKLIAIIIFTVFLILPQTLLLTNAQESSYLNDVEAGKDKVILPPTILSFIDSVDDYNAIGERNPATAIFHVNDKGEITTKDGALIANLDEAKAKLNNKTIPAYYIKSAQGVSFICDYYSKTKTADAFVISDDTAILKAVKASNKYIFCVLDASDRVIHSKDDLFALREEANKADARVIILPLTAANIEYVEYLHQLLMTVWTKCPDNTDISLLTAATAGVSGIVGHGDVAPRINVVFNKYFNENSMLRMPNFVGHRGSPSLSQENTLAGSKLAVQYGATIIENDVYLTSDGVAVVMHDSTIDRTTNGTGNVASMTYEQLSKFKVDVNKTCNTEPIPKLTDYFDEFKGKDVILYIEIKHNDTRVIPEIIRLIKEYEIADQVNLITFNKNQMLQAKSLMPEMSMGYLTSTIKPTETSYLTDLETVLNEVIYYKATFNPSFQKGTLGENFITAALNRGVIVLPWTINSQADLDKYFMMGTYGITTNYTQLISNYPKHINVPGECKITPSESFDPQIDVVTYSGKTVGNSSVEMILIEGNPTVKFENGSMSFTEYGNATVMFSYKSRTTSGDTYYIYSQPVLLNIAEEVSQTTVSDNITTAQTTQTNGCNCNKSSAFIIPILLMSAIPTFIFKRRK